MYDEVIASLPSREVAAKSLYGKGVLLRIRKEYRESIEALQTLTRRFPKTTEAADAFLLLCQIYLDQSKIDSQNPDLLSLAQINLTNFEKSFPGEERLQEARTQFQEMKEIFAHSLYETGRFYEKKKKKDASKIYYDEAVKRFPNTKGADKSFARLMLLNPRDYVADRT